MSVNFESECVCLPRIEPPTCLDFLRMCGYSSSFFYFQDYLKDLGKVK